MNKLYQKIQNWKLNRVRSTIKKYIQRVDKTFKKMKDITSSSGIESLCEANELAYGKMIELVDKESELLGYLKKEKSLAQ